MTQFVTIELSEGSDQDFDAADVASQLNSASQFSPSCNSSHSALTRSLTERSSENSLSFAIARHIGFEKASFHTPGHKGRALSLGAARVEDDFRRSDLTELPGLDDLSYPQGTILEIERRACRLWQSKESVISVNGASAGLIASILALSARGKKFLVPRNAHRSVVSALVLTGLVPIWYEPVWDADWSMFAAVSETSVEQLLYSADAGQCAGILVVSPTYGGAVSDIEAIARHCRRSGIPLLVDEAHGAHRLPGSMMPPSAIKSGADITVHSLHKTLGAFTQCGIVHLSESSLIDGARLRAALNLVQTTSPSYPLLASIEDAIKLLEDQGISRLNSLSHLREQAQAKIQQLGFDVFQSRFQADAMHILLRWPGMSNEELFEYLADRGIFAETVLGDGVLLMIGIGTNEKDVEELLLVLSELSQKLADAFALPEKERSVVARINCADQVLSPRQAFFMPSEVVSVQEAVGRIAAECIAPCPPGFPICVPGQRIPVEVTRLTSLKSLRVVCEPLQRSVAE